jgi:dihydropteroate synthase
MSTIIFQSREHKFHFAKQPYLMGILNLTPDSFSDGGKFNKLEEALQRAEQLQNEGADILDIGGESTRPGFAAVDSKEELRRVIPLIKELKKTCKIPISIDTYKAEVAEAALQAGASIVNDISAMQDKKMPAVLKKYSAGCILMHKHQLDENADAVQEVKNFLQNRVQWAVKEFALKKENFVLDPGIGFGKTQEQNLSLIKHIAELRSTGNAVLLGMSRKSFIGRITGQDEAAQRLSGSIATTVYSYLQNCDILRVHDVLQNHYALQVIDAIKNAP